MSHATPKRRRPGNGHKRKPFDFVPNKEQVLYGAFLDLGRPLRDMQSKAIAMRIADIWGEDIYDY